MQIKQAGKAAVQFLAVLTATGNFPDSKDGNAHRGKKQDIMDKTDCKITDAYALHAQHTGHIRIGYQLEQIVRAGQDTAI